MRSSQEPRVCDRLAASQPRAAKGVGTLRTCAVRAALEDLPPGSMNGFRDNGFRPAETRARATLAAPGVLRHQAGFAVQVGAGAPQERLPASVIPIAGALQGRGKRGF